MFKLLDFPAILVTGIMQSIPAEKGMESQTISFASPKSIFRPTDCLKTLKFPLRYNRILIAKFVVSRCPFANLEWVFLFRQSFEWGRSSCKNTMQRTRSAWPAKTKLRMTLDYSRIAKEIAMMSGVFIEGRRQTLLYSCKGQE